MDKFKSFLNSYTMPIVIVAVLAGVFFKWGGWAAIATAGIFISLLVGMLMIDFSATANMIYWTIVAGIGAGGYYVKNYEGDTPAIIFTTIVIVILVSIIMSFLSHMVHIKYK